MTNVTILSVLRVNETVILSVLDVRKVCYVLSVCVC